MTTVVRQIHFAVKGNRKRVVAGSPTAHTVPKGRIPRVTKLMALAIRFEKLLQDGVVGSQSDLAELARVTQPRMTQIMNLLHLAPDIQEEILFLPKVYKGRDPITERDLRRVSAEPAWARQRPLWELLKRP